MSIMQVLIASIDYVPSRILPEWEEQLSKTVRDLSKMYQITIPYEAKVNNNKVEFRLLNVPLLEWYKEPQVRNEIVNKIVYNLNQFAGAK
jgi:hypothetical protein